MKALIISSVFSPMKCGIGDYVASLSIFLNQKLDLTVLTTKTKETKSIVSKNFNYKFYPIIKKWNIHSYFLIAKFIIKYNFDIINYQHSNYILKNKIFIPQFFILFWRFFYPRKKIVSTIHEFTESSFLGRIRNLLIILFSNYVIFINNEDKRLVSKILFFKKNKLFYIPIGSNIPKKIITKKDIYFFKNIVSLKSNEIIISFFGFIDKDKGIEDLFQAIKLVLKNKINIKLLILTNIDFKNNLYHQSLRDLSEKLGIAKAIYWLGYQSSEKVSIFLQNSYLVVLPFKKGISLRRGSFIAAINNGVPVITTFSKFVPEILIDRENIILSPANKPDLLAKKIIELIINKKLYKNIKNNIKNLAQFFAWSKIADDYFNIFKKIISNF